MRQFYVYMLASRSRRLYVGVTSDLRLRLVRHRQAAHGFTSKYRINRLVWLECTENSMAAIEREKQIKGWTRTKKIDLIEKENAGWRDLACDFLPAIE